MLDSKTLTKSNSEVPLERVQAINRSGKHSQHSTAQSNRLQNSRSTPHHKYVGTVEEHTLSKIVQPALPMGRPAILVESKTILHLYAILARRNGRLWTH